MYTNEIRIVGRIGWFRKSRDLSDEKKNNYGRDLRLALDVNRLLLLLMIMMMMMTSLQSTMAEDLVTAVSRAAISPHSPQGHG